MKKNTYFVDIDGTIFEYRKFETYESTEAKVVYSMKRYLQTAYDDGHMIVLTTARPESLRTHTLHELRKNNIPYHKLVMGLERGTRYLINDMEPDKLEKRAIAINIKRNGGI